jgi:predicted phage-related endonuclease
MVTLVDKPADRGDWLTARHPYFNASDAGCLYGVHPFKSLADVALDKMQPQPDDAEATEAMDRGNRLEPAILGWFADKIGVQVVTPDYMPVNGKIMATLDGVIVGNDSCWIEAKSSREYISTLPDYWYWQVVAQAAASGRRKCYVAYLDASMRFDYQEVHVPEDHVDNVLARAEQFMAFVEMGMMPEGVELETRHILRMFPQHEADSFIDIDDEQYADLQAWEIARLARLSAKENEDEAKNLVANMLGEAEGLRYDGKLVCTWRTDKRGVRTMRSTKMLEVF